MHQYNNATLNEHKLIGHMTNQFILHSTYQIMFSTLPSH